MMLIDLLIQQPQVLGPIVRATPQWVWGLLAALVALGASQLRNRNASLQRALAMPVAMAAFSAYGVASAFGGSGQLAWALVGWAATALAVALLLVALAPQAPRGTRFDAATRSFAQPGSAWPLVLILGVFTIKYGVGVELAMEPRMASALDFALPVCLLYGVFNGMFAARALRLLRLVRTAPAQQPTLATL